MKAGRALLVLGWATVAGSAVAAAPPRSSESLAERLHVAYTPSKPAGTATVADSPGSVSDDRALVRLPRFEVKDARIPLLDDEVLTARGRLIEAKLRHLSPMYQHTFGPLSAVAALYFNPLMVLRGVRANDAEAMVLYEQEAALRRKGEAESLEKLGHMADTAARIERVRSRRTRGQEKAPNDRR